LNFLKQEILTVSKSGSGLNRESVDRVVERLLDIEPVERLLLYQLLGLPLQEKEALLLPTGDLLSRRYQSLLGRLLIASPANKSTMIIIEDLHWIDQATSLIVEQLLQPSSAHQCLVVLSCRPEYKPQWLSNVVTSNLYLSKLRQSQTEKLLSELLQDSKQVKSAHEITQLAERTGGNPLFVEELVKSLLRQTEDSEAVPESIEGALVSRLDRLGPARDLAQIASVIGRHFDRALLLNCTGQTTHEFDQYFDTLVKAEIFYPTGDPRQWYFKHALIRDAAYQTLEEGSKKRLHQSIATTIEEFDKDLAEVQPSLLAQHWELSGNLIVAITYWLKSAQRNMQLFSISDCIDQCNHALELCDSLPAGKEELQLALYATLGPALMNRFGYADDKAGDAYSEALKLAANSSTNDSHINIMFGNWTYFCVRAEHQKAFELAQQMIRISEAGGIRHEICESWMAEGISDFYRGEFIAARHSLQKAVDYYDAEDSSHHIATYGQDPFVASTNFQSWNELVLGNLPQSLAHAEAAIQRARETEHPMTLAYALSYATYVYMTIGEFEVAEKLVDESIQVCTDNEIILFLGLSLVLQALLYFNRNEVELGEQAMTRATDVYLPTGAQVMIPNFLIIQAEVLVKAARIDEAEALTGQALEIIDHTGENWCLGPALATKFMINHLSQRESENAQILSRLSLTLEQQQAEGIKQLLMQKGLPLEAGITD
jgi:predicted ATPase